MLAIARALMAQPRLLLLDEPSLGLAPLVVRQIFDAIKTLNAEDGLTVFLVEQNAYHALKLAHRGYVMVNGQITLSRHGQRIAGAPRNQVGLSRGRPALNEISAAFSIPEFLYEEGSFGVFVLVTIILGGGAATAGRPRHSRNLAAVRGRLSRYGFVLAGPYDLSISACYGGTFLSFHYYLVDAIFCMLFGLFRLQGRPRIQMVTQYRWLNEPDGPMRWRRKMP